MNTLQEIERAIDTLTPQQIEELYTGLDQRHPQPIDAQLRADLHAGRLDDRINRALADRKSRLGVESMTDRARMHYPEGAIRETSQ